MKLILVTFTLLLTSYASANCISLEEAKAVASLEIANMQKQDQYSESYDYGWENAVYNLEFIPGISGGIYTSSWSISNWEDLRITVTCDGVFSFSHSYTED